MQMEYMAIMINNCFYKLGTSYPFVAIFVFPCGISTFYWKNVPLMWPGLEHSPSLLS